MLFKGFEFCLSASVFSLYACLCVCVLVCCGLMDLDLSSRQLVMCRCLRLVPEYVRVFVRLCMCVWLCVCVDC